MPRTKQVNVNLSDENNPQVQEAIQLLWLSPNSKKDIANKTGLNLGQIHRIYQMHIKNNVRNRYQKKSLPDSTVQEETTKKNATETTVSSPVEEKPKRHSTKKINDDIVLAFCSDLEKGEKLKNVAEKYGVSMETVRRYGIQLGVYKPNKDKVVSNSNDETTGSTNASDNTVDTKSASDSTADTKSASDKPEFIKASNSCSIKTQLIDGRHEMPISKYIFESVDEEHLFDFDWYDSVVRNWITENIPKVNGVWEKSIDCYMTGLPAASISVAKICEEMKVNLTFSHYAASTGRYEKQIVFDKYPVINTSDTDAGILGKFYEEGDIYIYNNTSIKELSELDTWYSITKRKYNSSNNSWKTLEHYLIRDYDDIFSNISRFIDSIKDSDEPLTICANTVIKNDSGYIYKDTILQSKNKSYFNIAKENKIWKRIIVKNSNKDKDKE